MAFKNGNTAGRGGKRKNAGRKPKTITLLKRQLAEDGKGEAEYAFSFLCTCMRNSDLDVKFRAEIARVIMDRVLGTAKQSMQYTGSDTDPLKIIVEYAAGQIGVAGVASGTEDNRS